ncbi:hypothetical protein NHX12_029234 [Muraenolepis orangiensis]|uniref:Uncharacterized protein n=1 Tax=Muraenolepis orangiensis TaxID=630683 RepID=A0A9Q0IMZ3_9TELE|nr:hypothetical protein NHX12_029234 [Muraenolepis orangiensis]
MNRRLMMMITCTYVTCADPLSCHVKRFSSRFVPPGGVRESSGDRATGAPLHTITVVHITVVHIAVVHITVVHITVVHITVVHITVVHITVVHIAVVHITVVHIAVRTQKTIREPRRHPEDHQRTQKTTREPRRPPALRATPGCPWSEVQFYGRCAEGSVRPFTLTDYLRFFFFVVLLISKIR